MWPNISAMKIVQNWMHASQVTVKNWWHCWLRRSPLLHNCGWSNYVCDRLPILESAVISQWSWHGSSYFEYNCMSGLVVCVARSRIIIALRPVLSIPTKFHPFCNDDVSVWINGTKTARTAINKHINYLSVKHWWKIKKKNTIGFEVYRIVWQPLSIYFRNQ